VLASRKGGGAAPDFQIPVVAIGLVIGLLALVLAVRRRE